MWELFWRSLLICQGVVFSRKSVQLPPTSSYSISSVLHRMENENAPEDFDANHSSVDFGNLNVAYLKHTFLTSPRGRIQFIFT